MNVSSYRQCNSTYIPILILYIGTKKKLRFDCKELSLETIYQCLYLLVKILNPIFDTSVLFLQKMCRQICPVRVDIWNMSITEPKIKLSYMELQGIETALKKYYQILCKCAEQALIFNLAHKNTSALLFQKLIISLKTVHLFLVTGWAFHYPHILPPILWCQEMTHFQLKGILMTFQFKPCWLLNQLPKNCHSGFHFGIPLPHAVDLWTSKHLMKGMKNLNG